MRDRRQHKDSGRRRSGTDRPAGRTGADVVYGVLPVLEVLKAGNRSIEKILVAEGASDTKLKEARSLARGNGVPWNVVPRSALSRIVGPDSNHQGIVAVCSSASYADAGELIDGLAGADSAICLVLDGIEDPHNLGAIVRTAECAGVDAVFVPERRSAGLNETVAKTSAGAVDLVRVARVTNLNRLIEDLKEAGFWIAGADGEADADYRAQDWKGKWALVLGGEGSGLHRLTREKCDVLVKIPLYGRISSLNVSVAAGVLLFEMVRQSGR